MQREKALAEAEGRIKENRENEDVNRRQMLARLEEERKKAIESIEATFRCFHPPSISSWKQSCVTNLLALHRGQN